MLSEGEKLDEFLSGYIDGALSDAERELVEQAARDDARVAQRLLQLRLQVDAVRELGRQLARTAAGDRPAHSSRMAERVIAQAREQARGLGLAPDHFVFGEQAAVTAVELEPATAPSRKWVSWSMLAAAVLLAIAVPWWRTQEPATIATGNGGLEEKRAVADTTFAGQEPAASAVDDEQVQPATFAKKGAESAGRLGNLTFVLVVDIQMTAEGHRQQMLDRILNVAGITQIAPVPASPEVIRSLDEARMIVPSQNQNPAQPMLLTVVHAEIGDLDTALQAIWRDERHFPKVGLNLAIDARAALAREILKNASEGFNLSESFAVPLMAGSNASQVALGSPLSETALGERFVSSASRSAGWGGTNSLAAVSAQAKSTVLLVVHLVD